MKFPFVFLIVSLLVNVPLTGVSQGAKTRSIDPQTKEVMINVDGLNRKFIVHVPPTYKSGTKDHAVVFAFHGGGGKGANFYKDSRWADVGDREGFITVFPTGVATCVEKSSGPETKRFWMTSSKLDNLCPGQASHDDVKFVKQMLGYINSKYRVNKNRIYASGFSNGMGLILSKLLPELSNRFAAFGGVGSLLQESYGTGPIAGASPLLLMIGEYDNRFYVPAGTASIPITESGFEANVFLKESQETLLDMLQLSTTYKITDRPKYLGYRFTTSAGNGAAEMRYAVLKGIKHVFPQGRPKMDNGIVAAEVIWDFFKNHKK